MSLSPSLSPATPHPSSRRTAATRPWLRLLPETRITDAPAQHAPTALPTVVGADELVPTIHGDLLTYANFDHGASTPALASVAAAVEAATRTYSSVHRGKGWNSRVSSALYEAARDEVARFVGARPGDEVIFTRNTTDSFNLLASALPRDTLVLVFSSEHHATLLPWDARRTVRLPVPVTTADAEALLRAGLAETAHHRGPRLVVLNGASNVTGEYWPLDRLVPIAKAAGARVAVDAAQLAPHGRVDLTELDVDYVAFSGHKIYAPYGAGVLAGRSDWLDAARPYLAGGGATKEVGQHHTEWQRGPARHEAGSPNTLGAIALAAACSALSEHHQALVAHERTITERLTAGLRAIDGVTTYSVFGDDHDRAPVVTFTVDGLDPSLVSAALSAEYAIGVRDGKFCAHLLVDALLEDAGETVSSAIRVSAGLATTEEHVERLLTAVAQLAAEGPGTAYTHVDGHGWEPADDPRDLTIPRLW